MKKQFFVAAMAVALGAGLTACSSDNLDPKDPTTVGQKASTYMSVSFEFPAATGTRATDDGQGKATPDFNNKGVWNGQDKIAEVQVFVFKATGAAASDADVLEHTELYSTADLAFTQNPATGSPYVNSKKAFKVEKGLKTVFVVINPTTNSKALLTAATTNLGTFKTAYASADMQMDNLTMLQADMTDDKTRADEVARVENKGTATAKDVILMTGPSTTKVIEDGVSEAVAVSGQKNRAALTVQRAAARVLVTSTAESYDIKGVDPADFANTNFVAATVSKFTYGVAQGENKFFFVQKENGAAATDKAAFTTPAYAQVNATGDFWDAAQMTNYATIGSHYDYSGLWKNKANYAEYKGIKVETLGSNGLSDITGKLSQKLESEFVLPTLHKFNEERDQTGYRKGNTAYIIVRALLTPKKFVDNNGALSTATADIKGKDFYLGANGVYFLNKKHVQDPAHYGVVGQTAQKFLNGKVIYFAWLNPDEVAKAVNSPVIRNNVYHVQIKSVAGVGSNWNPLIPFDPSNPTFPGNPGGTKPNDPNNPTFPNNPNNPDPRPDNPLEPIAPPVDPKDPLTFKETWMSVSVAILPWQVHSYEIELSI